MANFFDQFDESDPSDAQENFFDQFDQPAPAESPSNAIAFMDRLSALPLPIRPGVADAALALGAGAVAEPIAGLAGIGSAITGGDGAQTVENVRESLSYQPQTESGQNVMQGIGSAVNAITSIPADIVAQFVSDEDAEVLRREGLFGAAGGAAAERFGPAVGAAVKAIPTAAVEAIGAKGALRGAKAVDTPASSQVRQAQEASEATGVPLFEGQQTLSPDALEKQSFVAQLPAGVEKSRSALERQNKAASRAVDNFLNQIAGDDAIVTGAEQFRTAAQKAVDAKRAIREERTSPLYRQAFADGAQVDVSDVVREAESIAADFPKSGEVSRSINKVTNLLKDAGMVVDGNLATPLDLKKLHNVKIEIDQMISKVGENSLGNTTKSKLVEIKNNLLEQMDEASPQYKEARQEFARLSPGVERFENSVVGKIARMDDTQLKRVSRQIFDPENVNRSVVTRAKKVIDDVDPDAWNALMRSEIERRMGSIKTDLDAGIVNTPGKLHNAIFGNAKQKGALMAGLEGDALKNMKLLEVALKRASLGRSRGSQTASRAEISSELRGGVAQNLLRFFQNMRGTTAEAIGSKSFDNRVKALSERLFDPAYAPETKKILRADKGDDLIKLLGATELYRTGGEQQ